MYGCIFSFRTNDSELPRTGACRGSTLLPEPALLLSSGKGNKGWKRVCPRMRHRQFMPKLAETVTKDKPVPLVNVFKEFQPQSENWTFLKRKEPFKPSTLYSFGHVQNSYFPFLPCSSLQSFSGWWVIRRGKPGADYLFLHIIRHLQQYTLIPS